MDKDLCCTRILRPKTQNLEFKATTTSQWTIDLEIGSEFKTLLSFGEFLNLNPWTDFFSFYVEMSTFMWKFAHWTPIWVLSLTLFGFLSTNTNAFSGDFGPKYGLIFTSFQENFLCIHAGVKQSLHTTTTKIVRLSDKIALVNTCRQRASWKQVLIHGTLTGINMSPKTQYLLLLSPHFP